MSTNYQDYTEWGVRLPVNLLARAKAAVARIEELRVQEASR